MLEFLNDYFTKIEMFLCIKFGLNINAPTIRMCETSGLAQINLLLNENRNSNNSSPFRVRFSPTRGLELLMIIGRVACSL